MRRALAVRACLRPALALRPAPLALLARSPLPAFGQPLSTAATGDTEVESLLDQWVGAKRSRNWVVADDLAKELEQLGVNPQEARPDPRRAMREAGPQGPLDAATEAKLDEWVAAKVARAGVPRQHLEREERGGGERRLAAQEEAAEAIARAGE